MEKISAVQFQNLIDNRPEGVEPDEIKRELIERGYEIEGPTIEERVRGGISGIIGAGKSVMEASETIPGEMAVGITKGIKRERPAQPEMASPVSPEQLGKVIGRYGPATVASVIAALMTEGLSIPAQILAQIGATGGGEMLRYGAGQAMGGEETLGEAAGSAAVMGAGAGAGQALAPVVGAIAGKLASPLGGRIAPGAEAGVAAAREFDVPLSAAEVTGSKTLALGESVLEKAPLSSDIINNFRRRQLQRITAIRDELIDIVGTPLTRGEVGLQAKQSLIKQSRAYNAKSDAMYDKVGEYFGQRSVVSDNLRAVAEKIYKEQSKLPSKLQNKELMGLVEELRRYPQWDWQSISATRSELGSRLADSDMAYRAGVPGVKFLSSSESGAYKRLHRAIDKDIESMADQTGPEAMATLKLARSFYRENKLLYNSKAVRGIMSEVNGPDRIVDLVFRPRHSSEIRQIRTAIGEQAFNDLRMKFLELNIMPKKTIVGLGDVVDIASIRTALSKFDDDTLRAIFPDKVLERIRSVGAVSNLVKGAERLAGNPSGTAQNLITYGQIGLIVADPVTGFTAVLTPPMLAKLYTSELGSKWLTTGLRTPIGDVLAKKVFDNIARISGMAMVAPGNAPTSGPDRP